MNDLIKRRQHDPPDATEFNRMDGRAAERGPRKLLAQRADPVKEERKEHHDTMPAR